MIISTNRTIVLFLAAAMLPAAHAHAKDVEVKFLPSGVTRKIGGYRPNRAEMDKTADIIKVAPAGLKSPKFGRIVIGDQGWAFILDEPQDQPATLYIDSNGDGDLTNDPETKWEAQERGGLTSYSGEGQVDLGEGNVGTLGLYRFDPKDERRAQLKNTLMFYADYGFEYLFTLDGKPFSTFAAGSLGEGAAFPVDRDGNGKTSRKYEMVKVGEPFNFTGTTYVFTLRDGALSLETAADAVSQLPMPPDLEIGKPALPFTATTMDGTEINFPEYYAGKLVMLDFWATWCGPCIGEIPNMKKAYADWHDQGFEILGISFDRANMADELTAFVKERDMPWHQIYQGKAWETTLGQMHDVSAIPFVLLIDGDSGKILATARELRGAGLSDYIGEQLKKKNADP